MRIVSICTQQPTYNTYRHSHYTYFQIFLEQLMPMGIVLKELVWYMCILCYEYVFIHWKSIWFPKQNYTRTLGASCIQITYENFKKYTHLNWLKKFQTHAFDAKFEQTTARLCNFGKIYELKFWTKSLSRKQLVTHVLLTHLMQKWHYSIPSILTINIHFIRSTCWNLIVVYYF